MRVILVYGSFLFLFGFIADPDDPKNRRVVAINEVVLSELYQRSSRLQIGEIDSTLTIPTHNLSIELKKCKNIECKKNAAMLSGFCKPIFEFSVLNNGQTKLILEGIYLKAPFGIENIQYLKSIPGPNSWNGAFATKVKSNDLIFPSTDQIFHYPKNYQSFSIKEGGDGAISICMDFTDFIIKKLEQIPENKMQLKPYCMTIYFQFYDRKSDKLVRTNSVKVYLHLK
jgi:hypothetical protein